MIVVSHLWRDEELFPPLTGVYAALATPCVVSALPEKYKPRVISWEQCKNAPIFDVKASDFLQGRFVILKIYLIVADHMNTDHYKPDPFSPLRSPLLFPTGHKDLPPTYFIVAGADPWRDTSLLYEEILREECGVKTKVDIFPGLPHGFWPMFPKAQFSKQHREKSDEGLKWLLEQSK